MVMVFANKYITRISLSFIFATFSSNLCIEIKCFESRLEWKVQVGHLISYTRLRLVKEVLPTLLFIVSIEPTYWNKQEFSFFFVLPFFANRFATLRTCFFLFGKTSLSTSKSSSFTSLEYCPFLFLRYSFVNFFCFLTLYLGATSSKDTASESSSSAAAFSAFLNRLIVLIATGSLIYNISIW